MTETEIEILAQKLAKKLFVPRWMTISQAALYSNIGQKKLKALAEQGVIRGNRDKTTEKGCWIFDRKSIDKFRSEMMDRKEDEQILAKFDRII